MKGDFLGVEGVEIRELLAVAISFLDLAISHLKSSS